ncbi:MAG TPA: 2Fe-2S iron-sulfur cluster-binding protein [Polyangia bacterium]
MERLAGQGPLLIARPPLNPRGLRVLPPARPRGEAITIEVDGDLVRAHAGEPVAVALFAAGVRVLSRSPKYHRPRGLFCGTGHCGSCLMRIDGRPNVRACTTPATPDLRCERQNAVPDADFDLLAAADWMFPAGMEHHRLMTGTRLGNEAFVKLVRRMGGTGTLPDAPAAPPPPARDRHVTVCVVGGGPAGLSAARVIAAARPSATVLLVDDQAVVGGSLLAEPDGWARARALHDEALAAGVEVISGATAIGVYPAERADSRGTLAVVTPAGLLRLTAERVLYATGAYDQNLAIADNDRPGTLPARTLGRLAFHWGVAPEGRVVVVVPNEAGPAATAYLRRLITALERHGLAPATVAPTAIPRTDRHRDVIALGATPAPASELPRQHGAKVSFDRARGGFCVAVTSEGEAAPEIFCAGDVTGYLGPDEAAVAGAAVGAAIARDL